VEQNCELCEAARLTEWFFEDDHCWVAECEACCVPMVVWKHHDAQPDESTRSHLLAVLSRVVSEHFDYEPFIDDNMRNIPDHYHAHARFRGRWFGQELPRRSPPNSGDLRAGSDGAL